MASLAVQRNVSLGQQVADDLRLRIVRGTVPAGARLTEESLASEYGVSRGPARDAMRRLAMENLLDDSNKPGAFVKELTRDDVEQLYSLRVALETLAISRVMERRPNVEWDVLESAVASMYEAGERNDVASFSAADLTFHDHIYTLARHPRLLTFWEQIRPTFAALLDVTSDFKHDVSAAAREHEHLLETFRGGDIADARAALSSHILNAEQRMHDELAKRG